MQKDEKNLNKEALRDTVLRKKRSAQFLRANGFYSQKMLSTVLQGERFLFAKNAQHSSSGRTVFIRKKRSAQFLRANGFYSQKTLSTVPQGERFLFAKNAQ